MKDKEIIDKMIEYSVKICNYCNDTSFEDFKFNTMLIEACVFNISQIGELAIKLSPELRDNNKQIAWNKIYGLRNRIVHDYVGINIDIIWQIISDDIPILSQELNDIKEYLDED